MKYLFKFNESVSELTKADIDKIEDLFLDWNGEIHAPYGGTSGSSIAFHLPYEDVTKIKQGWEKHGFFYVLMTPLNQVESTYWNINVGDRGKPVYFIEDFQSEGGFISQKKFKGEETNAIVYPHDKQIVLNSASDVDKLFTEEGNKQFYKLFNLLDKNYKIHEYLKEIMFRTNGIKHYGFNHEVKLIVRGAKVPAPETVKTDDPLVLRRRRKGLPDSPWGGIDLTLFVQIKIMKPKKI